MTRRRTVQRAAGELRAEFRAVPSKSDTHRALVAAALGAGRCVVAGPLDADDTRRTRDGLRALGVPIAEEETGWAVTGLDGAIPGGGFVELGESGTSCRFLAAVAALGEQRSRLDGAPRLRERPLGPLVGALRALGAVIDPDPSTGGLPAVAGGVRPHGGRVEIEGSASSQFASALLLIAPRLSGGLRLEIRPPAVSLPYVAMTRHTLATFGVAVEADPGGLAWAVGEGPLYAERYAVEGDWSAASYFLAAAAVVGGRVRIDGLSRDSAQADARLATILEDAGVCVRATECGLEVEGDGRPRAFDLDMRAAPDVVPTLSVIALFADGPCRIGGVAHLRLKESDRIEAIARNARALGAEVETGPDRIVIDGRARRLKGASVATGSDHRIAMAFAVAGLRLGGVEIDDAGCVAKSNPGFWDDFARLER